MSAAPGLLPRLALGAATVLGAAVKLGGGALAPWRFGGGLQPEHEDARHLQAALQWLCRAQDACQGRGVPALYHLGRGWGPAYPETSGYIIATFLAAARGPDRALFLARAIQLGDWELALLAPSGGVLSSPEGTETRVFNTGQVILGLCALGEELGEQRYLDGAVRAGDYLLGLQEHDGRWERDTHCGARTYHARVCWGLLRLAALSGQRRFAEAAARNLAWVLRQATPTGWFANCGFHADPPITHVLAYTLRGLLESHALADPAVRGLDLLAPVLAAAASLMGVLAQRRAEEAPGMLPAAFDSEWRGRAAFSCLTGNAQLSIVLARLSHLTRRDEFARAARTLLSAAKRGQRLREGAPEVRGALGGSHPLGGAYCAHSFPNWAAKFLADALLLQVHQGEEAFNVLA